MRIAISIGSALQLRTGIEGPSGIPKFLRDNCLMSRGSFDVISPRLLEGFKTLIDVDHEKILFLLEQAPERKKKSEPPLGATDYGCYWCEISKKTAKLVQFQRWFDLRKLTYADDLLTFSWAPVKGGRHTRTTGTFRGQAASRLCTIASRHLSRILPPSEMPEIKKGTRKTSTRLGAAHFDPVLRYCLLYRRSVETAAEEGKRRKPSKKELYPHEASTATFEGFVNSRDPVFRFRLVPPDTELLLKCLCIMPHIETMLVPGFLTGRDQQLFLEWLATQEDIHRLEFAEAPLDLNALIPVLRERIAMKKEPIWSFVFTAVPLTREHLDAIGVLVEDQVTRLAFIRSLSPDLIPSFVELLQREACNGLNNLMLDGVSGLDAKSILSHLPKLNILSLPNCGIEVSGLLKALNERPNAQDKDAIVAVDLSGNPCKQPIPADQTLPPALNSIRAESIQWEGDNLRFFWSALKGHPPFGKILLSLSNAKMNESQWQRFFVGCPDLASEFLSGLHWNSNPLHTSFFDCVSRSKIESLTLVGSLKPNDPALPACLEFIRKATALVDLTVSGTDDVALGTDDLRALFDAIKVNRSIERLAVCGHSVGPALLPIIGDALMSNRKISSLRMEGNNMSDIAAYGKVFRLWANRGRPLIMQWPIQDFSAIISTDPSARHLVQELVGVFELIGKGNPNIDVPVDTVEKVEEGTRKQRERSQSTSAKFPASGQTQRSHRVSPSREKSIVFTDVDPIDLKENAEHLLPLPPWPPLHNSYVAGLFESEFDLTEIIEALRKQS